MLGMVKLLLLLLLLVSHGWPLLLLLLLLVWLHYVGGKPACRGRPPGVHRLPKCLIPSRGLWATEFRGLRGLSRHFKGLQATGLPWCDEML